MPRPSPSRPAPAPARIETPDPVCRAGTFTTENRSSFYDVSFTNTSDRACVSVRAYCLCSVSFGAYRQSANLSVAGSFAPGARSKIASVATTGPADRDIDWSWCRFRD